MQTRFRTLRNIGRIYLIVGWITLAFSALGVIFAIGNLVVGLSQGVRLLTDTIQYFVIAMLPPITALIAAILLLGLGESTELLLEVLESNEKTRKMLESKGMTEKGR